ncbi:MAG TPA: acyl-CoA dehydrogenase family protein [Gammaproteobacteria bacterium]|nr:acyl-CoA dehydrogenase family protein [Gammaproteobacteria bacterium]
MNLDLPEKLQNVQSTMRQVSEALFRPISRKYDRAEHEYPKELDMMRDAAGDSGVMGGGSSNPSEGVRNGSNMSSVVAMTELCWGDTGLTLTIPGRGLGNAAIAAVATPEQKQRFGDKWAAMAITEPGAGSDSAAIQTTAKLDGDEWVLNGEKIFVTAGDRCEAVVVWATVDRSAGKAGIKSFVVEKGTPGMEMVRLEKKLGIRASDTAAISFTDCRIPKDNILGSSEVSKSGFGGVMQTFDNTRPVVAAMAVGVARAALERTRELLRDEGVSADYSRAPNASSALEAELYRMEADWEAARLLTLQAAWMADNGKANSLQASISKAKAGRMGNAIALRCVELCAGVGYGEQELLEKWARDSKILDIFEGTQQIQQLIVARQVLGKSSRELR